MNGNREALRMMKGREPVELGEGVTPERVVALALDVVDLSYRAHGENGRASLPAVQVDWMMQQWVAAEERAASADRDSSDYADAMDARMEDALLIENLRIAFLVLAESGHGGGMAEVRKWFAAGATGPILWPGGKLFEVWAAEHGIHDCNGAMGFRRGARGRAA